MAFSLVLLTMGVSAEWSNFKGKLAKLCQIRPSKGIIVSHYSFAIMLLSATISAQLTQPFTDMPDLHLNHDKLAGDAKSRERLKLKNFLF